MLSLFCFVFSFRLSKKPTQRYKVKWVQSDGCSKRQQLAIWQAKRKKKNWFDTKILTLDWEYKYFFWGEEMIIISIIIFRVDIRKFLTVSSSIVKPNQRFSFPFLN